MRKKTQTFCTSTCSLSFGESGFLKRKLGSQSWPVVRVVLHCYSFPFIIQKQDVLDEGSRHIHVVREDLKVEEDGQALRG
jgi:hypothetical protein